MTQHRPVRGVGGNRGRVPTFADAWDANKHFFGVSSSPSGVRPSRQSILPMTIRDYMEQLVNRPFASNDSDESRWLYSTRLVVDPFVAHVHGQPEASQVPADLEEALGDLQEVPADAREEGMAVPSEVAFTNAKRLLQAMYRISPRRYGVYPAPDGYIAIDARGANGRIAVTMCGSDGGALCLVTIDSEQRRARYDTARQLPDGFIREALHELGAEPA